MPKSRKRKNAKKYTPSEQTQEMAADLPYEETPEPLPTWYKVVMFGLMILGLLWIIVYYLSGAMYPVPNIGGWNIVIGFGIAIVGFLMTTRWQ